VQGLWDGLSGRQKGALLGLFAGLAVLFLVIAWALSPNWVWDHPLVALVTAGAFVSVAERLLEPRAWWQRLASVPGPPSDGDVRRPGPAG